MDTVSREPANAELEWISKRLVRRRWNILRSGWVDHIPDIKSCHCHSLTSITNFLREQEESLNDVVSKRGKQVSFPRADIPSIVLGEAIRWTYKALHVLGAAEVHIDRGRATWALTSAYQSVFFAAKAMMAFFGIGLGVWRKKSFVFDVSSDHGGGKRPEKLLELGAFSEESRCFNIGVLFDHRQIWELFTRILRISTCDAWSDGLQAFLSALQPKQITAQRHRLQYDIEFWVVEDLHAPYTPDHFLNTDSAGEGRDFLDPEQDNFLIALALHMTRAALAQFRQLRNDTNGLEEHFDRIGQSMTVDCHPLFLDDLNTN